jgi:hypothetical protein
MVPRRRTIVEPLLKKLHDTDMDVQPMSCCRLRHGCEIYQLTALTMQFFSNSLHVWRSSQGGGGIVPDVYDVDGAFARKGKRDGGLD